MLFASDNEQYVGNVQYKDKETYTAKENNFLIPLGKELIRQTFYRQVIEDRKLWLFWKEILKNLFFCVKVI